MQRKLEVSLRLRGFVAVGESVPRYLSKPGLLVIVLVLIAATNMAATIPITNFVHSVGMTASIHVLSIQPPPGRSRSRGAHNKSHLPAAAEAAGSAISQVFLTVRAR